MDYYNSIKQEFLDNKVYHEVKDYSKNKKDLETYYNVGKLLIEAQGGEERAKYGNKLIKEYSKKLTDELGRGYSIAILKRMRQFYLLYKNGAPPAHLSWSHYQELLPIKDDNKRNYYVSECIKNNLSRNDLREKIKSNEYERLPEQTKIKLINQDEHNIEDYIKNPIIIPNTLNYEEISEKKIKYLILDNIELFLKELGDGFSFIGSEYKIKIGDSYNYIDMLLYNIEYSCYVVLEIKIREFKKQDIGQIKLYMNYIDKNIKKMNQNNTIGIILCRKENKFVLEYVSDSKVFVREYITV